jgi:hypothetical protein
LLQQRQNDIITLIFTVVIAIAIALMGLDIDIRIVVQTMKVNKPVKYEDRSKKAF